MKQIVKRMFKKLLRGIINETIIEYFKSNPLSAASNSDDEVFSGFGVNTRVYTPFSISDSKIGDYSYIAKNSRISLTTIGKFCSVGPNIVCGWGIHPTNGISTAPMFYSTLRQNGITLSSTDKIAERASITIGNDVFIGMNVTILDGVTINDGAVIGAGAVVSKDIPPYAIAVGNPIQIIKYRFSEDQIKKLLKMKWWNWPPERLKEVEENFFSIGDFTSNNAKGDL